MMRSARPTLVPLMVAGGILVTTARATTTTTATAPSAPPIRLLTPAEIERCRAVIGIEPSEIDPQEADDLRDRIAARMEAEDSAAARADLALAWANWELADGCAGAATRWVLGLRTAEDVACFRQAATRANDALAVAAEALDSMKAAGGDAQDEEALRTRKQTHRKLRYFAAAFAALADVVDASADQRPEAQDACRDAALDLAVLREDEDPQTATAARLWQAILLEAAGREDRAISVLQLSLARPRHLPYGFFLRLQRLQLLVDRGAYALVAGLGARMQAESQKWFAHDPLVNTRVQATIRAVRAANLWRWADALPESASDDADRLRDRANLIRDKYFGSDTRAPLYRLEQAIPVYMPLPDLTPLPAAETAPATAPAPKPTPTSLPTTTISI
jgi:hypothetical protein